VGIVSELEREIGEVASRVGPAVVGLGRGWSVGSGVVIAEGQVLTSAHNLRGDETTVSFQDGSRERADVAGVDRELDLAVLSVDTGDTPAVDWDPGLDAPGIGAAVVALSDPGGRGLRATLGFVSGEGRSFRGPRGRRVSGAIEHTAPLPRGSSGGPLVDTAGRLLGLNSLRLDGGLILAIPARGAAHDRITALARGETAEPRRLGVAVAPPRVARRLRHAVGLPERTGLLVRAVERGSPAESAGIERGDLLAEADGRELDSVVSLYAALAAGPLSGGRLPLTVVRGTEDRSVEVDFGTREAAA
jgi:serine protease Do